MLSAETKLIPYSDRHVLLRFLITERNISVNSLVISDYDSYILVASFNLINGWVDIFLLTDLSISNFYSINMAMKFLLLLTVTAMATMEKPVVNDDGKTRSGIDTFWFIIFELILI